MSQADDAAVRIERLVKGFFGPGNVIWPDQDPGIRGGPEGKAVP